MDDAKVGLLLLIGMLSATAALLNIVVLPLVQRREPPEWLVIIIKRAAVTAAYLATGLFLVAIFQWSLQAIGVLPPSKS